MADLVIYADVCCLNRPFDDQRQTRIRLEAEAVLLILSRCEGRAWQLLGSEAIDLEISQIPDPERREKVLVLAALATSHVTVSAGVERRAAELEAHGFKAYDALHLACAEEGRAEIFLTTDDRLLKRASRSARLIKVRVANPILWLLEVDRDEGLRS